MAVVLGSSTNLASGTGTRNWTSPTTASKAYGVVVISGGAVEETSGVTWGGAPMARIATGANTGGENGTTSVWFIDAPGTGGQTVEITRSGSTAYIATAYDGTSATGSAKVVPGGINVGYDEGSSTSISTITTSLTIPNGLVVALYGGLYSGENALSSITDDAALTRDHSQDFGNFGSVINHKTTLLTGTGSAYTSFAWTQSSDDGAWAVIAVQEGPVNKNANLTATGGGVATVAASKGAAYSGGGSGQAALVQEIGKVRDATSSTTQVLSVSKTVTVGNQIVVAFAYYGDTISTLSFTDNLGNTYNQLCAKAFATTVWGIWMFAADITTGGTLTTITADFNGVSKTTKGMAVAEYEGLALSSATDLGEIETASATVIPYSASDTIPAYGAIIGAAGTNNVRTITAGAASGSPSTTTVLASNAGTPYDPSWALVHGIAGASEVTGFSGSINIGSAGNGLGVAASVPAAAGAGALATGGGVAVIDGAAGTSTNKNADLTTTGGGVYANTQQHDGTSAVVETGGGVVTSDTQKGVPTTLVGTGGGIVTNDGRKDAPTGLVGVGGGIVTSDGQKGVPSSLVTTGGGIVVSDGQMGGLASLVGTGGGVVVSDGQKEGLATEPPTGGGIAMTDPIKGGEADVTTTGGGVATIDGVKVEPGSAEVNLVLTGGGEAVSDATGAHTKDVVGTGGGIASQVGQKGGLGVEEPTGGGVVTVTNIKGGQTDVVATGGGVVPLSGVKGGLDSIQATGAGVFAVDFGKSSTAEVVATGGGILALTPEKGSPVSVVLAGGGVAVLDAVAYIPGGTNKNVNLLLTGGGLTPLSSEKGGQGLIQATGSGIFTAGVERAGTTHLVVTGGGTAAFSFGGAHDSAVVITGAGRVEFAYTTVGALVVTPQGGAGPATRRKAKRHGDYSLADDDEAVLTLLLLVG